MKRFVVTFLPDFMAHSKVIGQLSFTEKRLRDKAFNEGIATFTRRSMSWQASNSTECIELDSTFAPGYLQQGRIFIEWGAYEGCHEDLDLAFG